MAMRAGVIGVGYLGQHHARVFSELEGVQLTAVVDADPARAEEIARKYGAAAYTDYREALGAVDAFSIVTPTTLHYAIARECIRAGKDLLIEKPVTATIEEADALIGAAEKAGVVVQVGHLERFNPAIAAVAPLIAEPRFFEAERLSPFLGRGVDVDITLDLMIHDIDILLSLLGRHAASAAPFPVDIKATGADILTGRIDTAKAWLDFGGGIHALVTASRTSPRKERTLRIFQRDSYLLVDYQTMEVRRYRREGSEIVQETLHVEKGEPLKEELRDFVRCVGSRSTPRVCALAGRNALKVALSVGELIRRQNNYTTAKEETE
ncbi:MAG: Gfo/Idh/MocA family oxidoreductase [Thermodesulfovibrionales bacterium]